MRAKLKGVLEGDATLTGILTGGIYDASELPKSGLTPTGAPGAFDSNGILLPCALIRFSTLNETNIIGHSRARFAYIWFYDAVGYENIDAAMLRCRKLLNRKKFKTASDLVFYPRWLDDMGDRMAEEFENAAASTSRYVIDYMET